jgi:hypothetical protein
MHRIRASFVLPRTSGWAAIISWACMGFLCNEWREHNTTGGPDIDRHQRWLTLPITVPDRLG